MNSCNHLVCVRCMTFNHAPYIVDAMNGFTMQQTTFPFVCTIVDDASTDGEQEIIRNYLHENFDLKDNSIVRNEETDDYVLCFAQHKMNKNCYFAVLWLKFNHYSIKKAKKPYLVEWDNNAKYIAMCEGDDYWIDPLKLQKQFNFMEAHPEYSLCFHANYELFPSGEKKIYKPKELKEQYSPDDVILGGGGFMATCSMFYRGKYLLNEGKPDFLRNCPIGDLPLMLYYVAKGNIGYIDEVMSVYRRIVPGSWSIRQNGIRAQFKHYKASLKMYDEYDKYTGYKYHHTILKRKKQRRKVFLKSLLKILLKRYVKKEFINPLISKGH